MAQNDMFVVMYKILAYIYECTKKGERPRDCEWSAESLGIPELYWQHVIDELVGHGYLSGVNVTHTGAGIVINAFDPHVTMEGVQFAQENSMMSKAKYFLQEVKASVPFI